METFALFEDSSACRLVYGFLDPDPDGPPVQLIPIGIADRQVKLSAENGCFAAYQVLRGLGHIDKGEKFCVSYQFDEGGRNFHALGESAGLAFCLRFAQVVTHRKTGSVLIDTLAATGILSDATGGAELRAVGVGGITAKLQAAMASLQPGGKAVYPVQNEPDLDPKFKADITEKGVVLIPVASVSEALTQLLGTHPEAVYPLTIEGLEQAAGLGNYHVERRAYLGRKISLPFTIVNEGDLDITVRAEAPGPEAAWHTSALRPTTLPRHERRTLCLDILPHNRLLFFLRHVWKVFVRKEATATLSFHIPEQKPYELTTHFRIGVQFTNPWPVLLLLLTLSGYAYIHYYPYWDNLSNRTAVQTQPPPGCPAPAVEKVEVEERLYQIRNSLLQWGEYLKARSELRCLHASYPEHAEIARFMKLMETRLHISSNLRLPPGQKEPIPGQILRISSGSGLRLEFTPSDICYFYVYLLDSHDLSQLFPNLEATSEDNPLQAGEEYRIPNGGKHYVLNQQPGQETFYFVASPWRARDLEELVTLWHSAPKADQAVYRRKLVERLKVRAEAQQAGIGAVFYETYVFQHE